MAQKVKVIGGNKLRGNVLPVPNKNAILAALPACILTDETVTYYNLPQTTDVQKMLEMLKKLGADVNDTNYSKVEINCKNVKYYEVDPTLGNEIRASIMFAGPLLVRFGKAKIPLPGGCVLGKRSISAHIDVFNKVDITTEIFPQYVLFTAPKTPKKSYTVWQMESSVTGTENLMLYCAGIKSTTTITNAASEPHVTQLLNLLKSMGANIAGIESNRVVISGKNPLNEANFVPEPDFVDIGGLIVATAVTKGYITITGANIPNVVNGIIQTFEKFNINIIQDRKDLIVDGTRELFIDPIDAGFPMAGPDLPKISPSPWPGFPVDCIPVIVTLGTKTKGKLMIQNWMYETGLGFVEVLNAMGANIFVADPQRVICYGSTKYTGGKITTPSIIQATKAIILASIADPVETVLTGVEILKRRYPNFIQTYKSLGVDIEPLEN